MTSLFEKPPTYAGIETCSVREFMGEMGVKSLATAYNRVHAGEWHHIHEGSRLIRINLHKMRQKFEDPDLPDQLCSRCGEPEPF